MTGPSPGGYSLASFPIAAAGQCQPLPPGAGRIARCALSVVAMSATLGSWGNEIGRELGRVLAYEFADREIIAEAAGRFGEGVMDLHRVTEGKPRLLERFSDDPHRYVTYVEAVILEMAARDNVILAGRGAVVVLSKLRHVLRVRVNAPEGVRAERVEQSLGLTREAAIDAVRESDRERGARVKFLYHVDWDDLLLYDLALNTERLTVERAVALVQSAIGDERFRTTPEAIRTLAELSVAAQAKAAQLTKSVVQF